MTKRIDMVGMKLGKWTVLEMAESIPQGEARCCVECEYGNTSIDRANLLRSGKSKGCRVCSALQRHQNYRDNGIVWKTKLTSNESAIKAWHRKHERECARSIKSYYTGEYGYGYGY